MVLKPETEENPGEESAYVVPARDRSGHDLRATVSNADARCVQAVGINVTKSYRLGVQIVLGTVLISASLCLATVSRAPAVPARAGQDLGPAAFPLGEFRLVERSGRTVTQADLADRVWIASFIFTRCPLSCPRISSVMKGLQADSRGRNVLLSASRSTPNTTRRPS